MKAWPFVHRIGPGTRGAAVEGLRPGCKLLEINSRSVDGMSFAQGKAIVKDTRPLTLLFASPELVREGLETARQLAAELEPDPELVLEPQRAPPPTQAVPATTAISVAGLRSSNSSSSRQSALEQEVESLRSQNAAAALEADQMQGVVSELRQVLVQLTSEQSAAKQQLMVQARRLAQLTSEQQAAQQQRELEREQVAQAVVVDASEFNRTELQEFKALVASQRDELGEIRAVLRERDSPLAREREQWAQQHEELQTQLAAALNETEAAAAVAADAVSTAPNGHVMLARHDALEERLRSMEEGHRLAMARQAEQLATATAKLASQSSDSPASKKSRQQQQGNEMQINILQAQLRQLEMQLQAGQQRAVQAERMVRDGREVHAAVSTLIPH